MPTLYATKLIYVYIYMKEMKGHGKITLYFANICIYTDERHIRPSKEITMMETSSW